MLNLILNNIIEIKFCILKINNLLIYLLLTSNDELKSIKHMKKLLAFILQKNKSNNSNALMNKDDLVTDVRNWYSDRYESLIVQRNLLFIFILFMLAFILSGIFIVGQIAASKTVEPFIVEIEDKTGITNVVNPLSRKDLTTDEALNRYFIMNYLRSRETYNVVDYDHSYRSVVRLLSSSNVYSEFRIFLSSNTKSPIISYGTSNSTSLKLRSIQFLDQGKTAQVRFTITENSGNKLTFNKIATLSFEYKQMELTNEERQINPLGFQVTNYRVDDEIL